MGLFVVLGWWDCECFPCLFSTLVFSFFDLTTVAHGILALQPGIKPTPSALEAGSLNH